MKITITIDSNPISGTKTTINIDDEAPKDLTTGAPANLPIAIATQDLPAGTAVEIKQPPIMPDPPQPTTAPVRDKPEKSSPKTIDRKPANTPKTVEKTCGGCGDTFIATGKEISKRKYCDTCRANGGSKQTKAGAKPGRGPAVEYPQPPTEPAPTMTPQFLPGYEKTPEEIEALRTSFPIEPAPTHGQMINPKLSSSNFADPWDCQKCRDHLHVCDFHASMEADGKRPPIGRAPGV